MQLEAEALALASPHNQFIIVPAVRPAGARMQAGTRLNSILCASEDTVPTMEATVMETSFGGHSHSDRRACFIELLTDVNVLAVMMNPDARIIYCNQYLLKLTGWAFLEIKDRLWRDVFVPDSIHDLTSLFLDLLRDRPGAWHQENEIVTKSGQRLCIRWNNLVMRDNTGVPVAVACIGEDVTERALLQRELAELSTRERRAVQSELHDGLGQELFGLAMSARSLSTLVERGEPVNAAALSDLAVGASRAIDTCRRIAQGLAPLSDVHGGLVAAVERLTIMPHGWKGPILRFYNDSSAALQLSEEASEHFYKIAQEGLANALKHSGATTITLRINARPTCLVLEIVDDGRGMSPHEKMNSGLGLKIMRYRAARVHANMEIISPRGGGTRLRVTCARSANGPTHPAALHQG